MEHVHSRSNLAAASWRRTRSSQRTVVIVDNSGDVRTYGRAVARTGSVRNDLLELGVLLPLGGEVRGDYYPCVHLGQLDGFV